MSISNSAVDVGRRPLDYVLSPCAMAALGLAGLMAQSQRPVGWLPAEAGHAFPPPTNAIRRVVVFLPEASQPLWLLSTLRQAALLLNQGETPVRMLILSRCSASWLWRTLRRLVKCRHHLSAVRVVGSDMACGRLAPLLDAHYQDCPLLEQQAVEEERACGKRPGLTSRELEAVLAMYRGDSICWQAKHEGLSAKTLYNQRISGLKKMAELMPRVSGRRVGAALKGNAIGAEASLSPVEREFVQAIYSRQIFAVFQPIVGRDMRLQGMEILSRWQRDGRILLPGEFLPPLRARYAWLTLLAFTLREAVAAINRFNGRYYFSVNVPSCIAGGGGVLQMAETARNQLRNPQWADRLVLEYAETADLSMHGKTGCHLDRLARAGFRIMLDNCFSQGSVLFPVKLVRFNGYKLDRSVVNDLQNDSHYCHLIQSLIYYCGLAGCQCIAEGIDSRSKFDQLAEMGVDGFQGYTISPPVNADELEALVRRLG